MAATRAFVLSTLVLFGGALSGCGADAPPAPRTEPAASLSPVRHEISVDATLERMTETVCSEGPWTDRLVSIHAEARARLVRAEVRHADGRAEPLDAGAPGRPITIETRGLAPDDCVGVVLDLASPDGAMNGCFRADGVVVCATSAWLLAAEPWRTDARHRVTLALPDGMSMSPILARDADGLYLDERSHRYVGYAAIGRLSTHTVSVPGGCASLTVASASRLASSPHLLPWVERAASASAQLTGTSGARDAALTAIGMPGLGPVLFGMAGRGVVPSVILLASETPGPEIETDWTLVHELVHLSMPYVPAEDAWLSEGLATYYQEVLRARAGMQTDEDAWRTLDEGLRRGALETTGRSLRDESRAMRSTQAYGRVYWAGAAIALLWDVALREAGSSLDARISALGERRDATLSAEQLVTALDDSDGTLRVIAERWLDATEMPDVAGAYASLGLARGVDGALDFTGESSRRDAIMNPRPSLASNGTCPRGETIPRQPPGNIE